MNTKKISDFLKKERKNANLTQEEVAKILRVSKTTISKLESGKKYPSLEYLPKLSKLYGISINEILAGKRLSADEKETAADKNLLNQLEEIKVSKIAAQIILGVSMITIIILIGIVWRMAGANNKYLCFIFGILLLFYLLIELCFKYLKQ